MCRFIFIDEGKAMNWFTNTMGSSIGKKLLMAVTGLCFCGFLATHLAGNLTIYGGGEAFNAYAKKLHSLGALLTVSEFGLLFFALVHVCMGLLLFFENRKARPVSYSVKKNAGGQTFGAATMPYTGILMLAFVIMHLLNFSFIDKTDTNIFEIVSTQFSNPLYVFLYIAAMIIVAVHVSHGFWSAFQTLGANHPRYLQSIKSLGLVLSIILGIGFGALPIYISLRF
jgi:succinate dehydrogenase / fumarate reductase cytochrome b subunit